MPQIIAKSTWEEKNIEDKLVRGADGIEVQLLSRNDPFLAMDWEDFTATGDIRCIRAVHLPLEKIAGKDGTVQYTNYDIETPAGREVFSAVCARSSEIAKITGNRITIVCHTDTSINKMKELGIFDKTVQDIRGAADRYPKLDIAIENTTALIRAPFTFVELAEAVERDNVGCCFDTCHGFMTELETWLLRSMGCHHVPFETLFDRVGDRLTWLHLSDAKDTGKGYGYDSGHGYRFDAGDPKSMDALNRIMNRYIKGPHCPVCIEVQEKCYTSSVNFSATKEALKASLKNIESLDLKKGA